MMTFETDEEQRKKKKAIDLFVSIFKGSSKKLDPNDIDYKVFDTDKNMIAYAEVSIRYRSIKDAYPLIISAKKLMKIMDKRITPILIWCCDDGIIYGKADKISGMIKLGELAPNSIPEMVVLYDKQKEFKYVRFI